MRVLVTGSRGFLGRSLVLRLRQLPGTTVSELDLGIGPELTDAPKLQQYLAEVRPEWVFHLAGLARVTPAIPFATYFHSNFELTRRLLAALPEARCRVLLASSLQVYGPAVRAIDETAGVAPQTPYAYSKYLAERALQVAVGSHPGLEGIAIRFANLIGPGQAAGFVVPDLQQKIRSGVAFTLSNPQASRYFVDVEDGARAAIGLMQAAHPSRFEIFNLVTPAPLTIAAVYQQLCALAGKPTTQPVPAPLPAPQVSGAKFRAALPAFAFTPSEKALARA